ncbi:MAG TPA: hypothetical protein VJ851_01990 [Jatrophihabitans sp.]|nr:hypothetical protein [Jatrophihabitans sp.]
MNLNASSVLAAPEGDPVMEGVRLAIDHRGCRAGKKFAIGAHLPDLANPAVNHRSRQFRKLMLQVIDGHVVVLGYAVQAERDCHVVCGINRNGEPGIVLRRVDAPQLEAVTLRGRLNLGYQGSALRLGRRS